MHIRELLARADIAKWIRAAFRRSHPVERLRFKLGSVRTKSMVYCLKLGTVRQHFRTLPLEPRFNLEDHGHFCLYKYGFVTDPVGGNVLHGLAFAIGTTTFVCARELTLQTPQVLQHLQQAEVLVSYGIGSHRFVYRDPPPSLEEHRECFVLDPKDEEFIYDVFRALHSSLMGEPETEAAEPA